MNEFDASGTRGRCRVFDPEGPSPAVDGVGHPISRCDGGIAANRAETLLLKPTVENVFANQRLQDDRTAFFEHV